MSGMNTPTIFIKQDTNGDYYWMLCLSENSKKPTCKSPSSYKELFTCRLSALRFSKHLTNKLRIKACEEIIIEDCIGDKRKIKS
jgi:hypothetical protein